MANVSGQTCERINVLICNCLRYLAEVKIPPHISTNSQKHVGKSTDPRFQKGASFCPWKVRQLITKNKLTRNSWWLCRKSIISVAFSAESWISLILEIKIQKWITIWWQLELVYWDYVYCQASSHINETNPPTMGQTVGVGSRPSIYTVNHNRYPIDRKYNEAQFFRIIFNQSHPLELNSSLSSPTSISMVWTGISEYSLDSLVGYWIHQFTYNQINIEVGLNGHIEKYRASKPMPSITHHSLHECVSTAHGTKFVGARVWLMRADDHNH